jgi:hypothetical protein
MRSVQGSICSERSRASTNFFKSSRPRRAAGKIAAAPRRGCPRNPGLADCGESCRRADLVLTGKVVWTDGSPAVADVWLVDLDFPADSSQVDGARLKADGSCSLTGIEGRHYAVFAHFEMGEQHIYSAVLEMRQMTGKPIRLELPGATSSQDCTICRRFKLRGQSPLW